MTKAAAKPQKNGWTPARRARHSKMIRRWKPWTRSTGPKTRAGKAVSSQNAFKHGARAKLFARYRALLKSHSAFLSNLASAAKITRKYAYYAAPGCALALQRLISAKDLHDQKKMSANELLTLARRHRLMRFPARAYAPPLLDPAAMLRTVRKKRVFGWHNWD